MSHTDTDTAAIPISARNWAALATLTLPLLLIAIDSTVLNFAVPAISEALNPTSDQLLWIVDIYSFILAGLLVSMGSLGDRIGRRKLLIIGSAGFGAASILAAYAPSAELLILARLLLGIAGATLMPSTLSLIRNIFVNRRQRRVAIGVWSAAASGGAALGPIVGGIMLEHFWWGSVFLINIPVMVILLIVAPFLLPESKSPTAGRFDLISPILLLAAMFPLVYAIKLLAGHGMSAEVAGFAIVGVLMLVLFLRRQGRLEHPLLDLSLFRSRLFSVGIAVNLMSVFALIGGFFVITQFLQLVLGYSPLEAALWILPCLLAEILTALLAAQFVRFVPLHILLAIALLLVAAGVLLATVTGDGLPMVVFGVGMGILGLGTGTAYTLSEDAIISSAPADRAGSAAGVSETAYELGGALGVALLGTVLSIGYASHLVLPEGLTAAQGESAKQTIGGAFSVAGQLPADTASQLTEAAKQAFIFGSTAVGYAAGTLIVCTAILAFFFMREPARVTTRGAEPAP